MKKSLFLIPALFFSLGVSAQQSQDMVVLFDTSVSVLPIFDELSENLVRELLQVQLRQGDKFHLLSFADTPDYEFSQSMSGKTEEDRIITYISVLKPMGQHTDLISALNYLYRFANDLNSGTRKTLIILTDGIHDPPPDSLFYGRDEDFVRSSLNEIAGKIGRSGWNVRLVAIPDPPPGSEDAGVSYLETLSETLGAPIVRYEAGKENFSSQVMGNQHLTLPSPDLGEVSRQFNIPGLIQNYSEEAAIVNLKEILWEGADILQKRLRINLLPGQEKALNFAVKLPAETALGVYQLDLKFVFSETGRVNPDTFRVQVNLTSQKSGGTLRLVLLILLAALLAALVIFAIILLVRKIAFAAASEDGENTGDSPGLGTASGMPLGTASRMAPGMASRTTPGTASRAAPGTASRMASASRTLYSGSLKSAPSPARRAAAPALKLKTAAPGKPASENSYRSLSTKKDLSILSGQVRKNDYSALSQAQPKPKVPATTRNVPARAPGEIRISPADIGLAVQMQVSEQNPHTINRNICVIRKGEKKEIGGRNSVFSIFIINVDHPIARISFDGKGYTFSPLDPDYFPDLPGDMPDCLERYISVRDPDGRRTQIIFSKWESPLSRVNRIMHQHERNG
ncbi:MAG: VWA domain-containing protein [Spirochaetales bacterium]|jgi:hypothetical protein|nr:VWA domain-containing protein [Spirochaetales bacterium]